MTSSDSEHKDKPGLLARARRLAASENKAIAFIRRLVSRLAIVTTICLLIFAISGLWPPTTIVGSPSMTPNLQTGDLVFMIEEHRFANTAAINDTGVVTYQSGATVGYERFNEYGDVIIYNQNGNEQPRQIIHRARFWVNKGENWYDKANKTYIGRAKNCKQLSNCPAEHSGFITKGDSSPIYDQVGVNPISEPVKPTWITGTAEFRIPWLGRIRMLFSTV